MKLNRPISIRIGVVLAAASVIALSACASSATPSESAPAASSAPSQQQGPGGGGVSGEIAAITGSTLQVQATDSQTAVNYTGSTTITQNVPAALTDITTGVCVAAVSGAPGAADASSDSGAAMEVGSVVISTAVDGACASPAGGAGGGGFGGGGNGGTRPSGAATPPTARPQGAGGAGGFGGFATGLVSAVSGSTITVQTTAMDGTTSSQDVTVGDATTYSKTESADASALAIGKCVSAAGTTDNTGTMAATTLAVSNRTDAGCVSPPRRGGTGQRPGAGSTSTSGS